MMNQIKTGAIISYINIGLTIFLGIFVTPFIIHSLGDAEYGLYSLIGAFVGYLSILDLGLNNSIVRYVAKYRAKEGKRHEENFLAIALIIYSLIGVLIAIIGTIFYFSIDSLYGKTLNAGELEKAKIMMIIMIFNIAITLPGGAFTAICSGYEKFIFPRLLTLIKHIVRTALVFGILYFGADSIGLVLLDTVMNLLFICVSILYVFTKLKIRIKLYDFNWKYVKSIFNYSLWIFLFNLIYQFQWRTGQIILGSTTDTVTVAIYGVGVMLGVYFTTFGNVINGLILPKAVKLIETGMNGEQLTDELIRIGRITIVLLLYVFGAFALTGKDFIILWLGPVYNDAWLVTLLIMFVYIMPISQGFAHAILEAKKKLRFKTLSSLVFSSLGFVTGAFLSYKFKSIGMALGIILALFLLQNVMNVYYHKSENLNMGLFFKKTYFPIFFPFLLVLFVSAYLNSFFETNWVSFIISNLIYTVLFFVIIYYMYLNRKEKVTYFKLK